MVSSSITTTLVLGASGNTGRRLVEQLLAQQHNVKAIVRSKERFHEIIPPPTTTTSTTTIGQPNNLEVIEGNLLDMDDSMLQDTIRECDAVVSCLGHNMTFKGMCGKPRKLVTDSLKKAVKAIQDLQPSKPVKVILMSSNGVNNPNGQDNLRPWGERAVLCLIRALVPPHVDNEEAAAYLSKDIGKDDTNIEWVAVRPDDLIEGDVSDYEVLKIPNAGLFGAGQTTRANVGHFMSDLILNDDTWNKWIYEMPVPSNV